MAPLHRKKISISLLIPCAIVALVFGGLIWKKLRDSRDVRPAPVAGEPAASRKVVLFFVSDDARLMREGREMSACGEGPECVKELLDELFSGPVGDLNEAVPEGAAVSSVRLEGDLAVVDLTAPFAADLPAGSSAEMLAVYSVVNTVCVNYPRIARVLITVEGKRNTVLRHLDLSEPLTPDYSLVRDEPAAGNPVPPAVPPPADRKKGQP